MSFDPMQQIREVLTGYRAVKPINSRIEPALNKRDNTPHQDGQITHEHHIIHDKLEHIHTTMPSTYRSWT